MGSDDDGSETRKTTLELMNAKVALDRAVENFARAQRLGDTDSLVASEELHTRLIGLWWRMKDELRKEDCWEDVTEDESLDIDHIYNGYHPTTGEPITISGLKELRGWMSKESVVSTQERSPLNSRSINSKKVKIRLPADAALTAAELLSAKFHDFGWDPERREDTHVDEPTQNDLAGLLKVRGQTEALEGLPERFKKAADNGGSS